VTQVGLEAIAAAFAYGTGRPCVSFCGQNPCTTSPDFHRPLAMADAILFGWIFGGPCFDHRDGTIRMRSSEALGDRTRATVQHPQRSGRSAKRPDLLVSPCANCTASHPLRLTLIALPEGAPLGSSQRQCGPVAHLPVLRLRCVPPARFSTIPTSCAQNLSKMPACSALCESTCPEKVISLKPQIDFRAAGKKPRIIKEEEPALCIRWQQAVRRQNTIDKDRGESRGPTLMYPTGDKRLDAVRDVRPTAASSL